MVGAFILLNRPCKKTFPYSLSNTNLNLNCLSLDRLISTTTVALKLSWYTRIQVTPCFHQKNLIMWNFVILALTTHN